jgi:Restriction endonuclease
VNLDDALGEFDRVEANLSKIERVWTKLQALIPDWIVFGEGGPDDRQYRDLCRDFARLLTGLPPIDGWSISARPLELAAIAQIRFAAQELGEIEAIAGVESGVNEPGLEIDEYRSRLHEKRRQLVRSRLNELVAEVESLFVVLAEPLVRRDDPVSVRDANWERLERLVSEVDRLFGPAARSAAWRNIHRHLGFAMACDLFDIKDFDWPAIKSEIEQLTYDDTEPLPVAVTDLGSVVASRPSGPVGTALNWQALDANRFERLIFAIISDARGYENPEWLTQTNAPDRGRDLSVSRVRDDALAGVIRDRVIIQCKHWLTRSVGDTDISDGITKMAHWEPPPIDFLVIATSGRFTSDAVQWAERHNHSGKHPKVELWAETALERHLAERPNLVATFKLR